MRLSLPVLLATIALVGVVLVASTFFLLPTPLAATTIDGGPASGESSFVNCTGYSGPGCTLAAAGSNWTAGPPARWCNVTYFPVSGPNGTFQSETVRCMSTAVVLSFYLDNRSEMSGRVFVTEPTQVWFLPDADGCSLFSSLARAAFSCPQPAGYVPPYSWNFTYPAPGTIDLGLLNFSFGLPSGVVPAGSGWALWFVDQGVYNEQITALSQLEVRTV